jgi:hypothetical protein
MFKKLLKSGLLLIFMVYELLLPNDMIAETAKDEDMFDKPLQWAAKGWSVSKVIDEKTITNWQEAYGFNSSCSSKN